MTKQKTQQKIKSNVLAKVMLGVSIAAVGAGLAFVIVGVSTKVPEVEVNKKPDLVASLDDTIVLPSAVVEELSARVGRNLSAKMTGADFRDIILELEDNDPQIKVYENSQQTMERCCNWGWILGGRKANNSEENDRATCVKGSCGSISGDVKVGVDEYWSYDLDV